MGRNILVVEDDRNISDLIHMYLVKEGFDVRIAGDGGRAVEEFQREAPDLILLDIMLPVMDGWSVTAKVRETSRVPIIMLTAKSEVFDRIQGLEMGADDYIVKPFDLDELGARVAAHLRREQRHSRAAVRFFGECAVDYSARTVTVGGQAVALSRREFDILELLSLHAGQVFDRERIYEAVWGLEGDGSSDVVMEHIRKIRAKLGLHTLHGYIETVWGCGYKWNG